MKLQAIFYIILKNLWLQLRKKKKKRQEIKMTLQPFKLKLKMGLERCETVA